MTCINGTCEWHELMAHVNDIIKKAHVNDMCEWCINGTCGWHVFMAHVDDIYSWHMWISCVSDVWMTCITGTCECNVCTSCVNVWYDITWHYTLSTRSLEVAPPASGISSIFNFDCYAGNTLIIESFAWPRFSARSYWLFNKSISCESLNTSGAQYGSTTSRPLRMLTFIIYVRIQWGNMKDEKVCWW